MMSTSAYATITTVASASVSVMANRFATAVSNYKRRAIDYYEELMVAARAAEQRAFLAEYVEATRDRPQRWTPKLLDFATRIVIRRRSVRAPFRFYQGEFA